MARKMPTGRAGNYAAPVDTVGMDEDMKASLGLGPRKKKDAKPKNGFVNALKKVLGQKG